MGYKIEYGASESKKLPRSVRKYSTRGMALVFFAAFLLMTALFWPEGRTVLRDIILPGDGAVTAAALQGMVTDLSGGEELSSAVTAFCREIIAGAG